MPTLKENSPSSVCLALAIPALCLSSISTLAAGLAWLMIIMAGLGAWWQQKRASVNQGTESRSPALQASGWWLLACVAAFVLMAIPTAYWDAPWPERHPQWRLMLGALGLWLLLRAGPPGLRSLQALATAGAVSSLLAYGLVVTVGSDAAPTNRIPWMAGLSLLSCALLTVSFNLNGANFKLRQFWLVASALMMVTVLLSGVRGSWPLVLLWPLLLSRLYKFSPALWLSVWRWLLPALAVMLAAGLAVIPDKDNPALRVLEVARETQTTAPEGATVSQDSSSGVRLALYKASVHQIMQPSWLGIGHAHTKELIRQTMSDTGALIHLTIVGHMHSDLLHPWVEFGFMGLAGYLAYAVGLGMMARILRDTPASAGLVALLLMHLLTGLSNVNFAHNYYPVMLLLSIALVLLPSPPSRTP